MEAEAPSILNVEDADSLGAVPRIAGIGAPIAITQTEDLSEGKILGQVSSMEASDFGQTSDEVPRASWPGWSSTDFRSPFPNAQSSYSTSESSPQATEPSPPACT